jgi:hypothetical protein
LVLLHSAAPGVSKIDVAAGGDQYPLADIVPRIVGHPVSAGSALALATALLRFAEQSIFRLDL